MYFEIYRPIPSIFSLTLIYSLLHAFNAFQTIQWCTKGLSEQRKCWRRWWVQYMGLLSYLILSGRLPFSSFTPQIFIAGTAQEELGLYATLGMKKKQIIRTLFFETMLVNIFPWFWVSCLEWSYYVILSKVASGFLWPITLVIWFSLIVSLSSY